MPVSVSYPGVYIQEVPSGVRTITGVSTSIAAFFGRTLKGPIDKAVNCLSYSDFLRTYGGPHKSSDLASSVRQFFDNGGTQCYIVRLAKGAQNASIKLKNLAGTEVLEIEARDAGLWGNNVRLEIDYATLTPDETFNMRVIHEENGNVLASEPYANLSMDPDSPRNVEKFVSASSSLIKIKQLVTTSTLVGFSESRKPLPMNTDAAFRAELNTLVFNAAGPSNFEMSVDNGPFTPVSLKPALPVPLPAAAPFDTIDNIIGEITKAINAQLPAGVKIKGSKNTFGTFGAIRLESDTGAGKKYSVKIRSAVTTDVAKLLMMGVDQGGIETAKFANLRPVPNGTFLSGNINNFATLQADAFNKIGIVGAPFPVNNVDLLNSLVTTGTGTDLWHKDNKNPTPNDHGDGIREKLDIMANAINNNALLPVTAQVWGYHFALLPKGGIFSSLFGIKTGTTVNVATGAVAGGTDMSGSFTMNNRQYALGDTDISHPHITVGQTGQDDDQNPATADIDVATYFGDENKKTGFYALERVDIFNLMVLPGDRDINESDYEQISVAASVYCEKHRAFLLLDAPEDWSKDGNLNKDQLKYSEIRNGMVKTHSAIFYPRIKYSDAGKLKYIGPSGMIAGVMARTDSQRGVWKAPAGIEADLRGAFDLEVKLTDLENGILNKQGVNCIRMFPNGVVSWGARTLDGFDDNQTEWKYIPVRRLALFLEESLFRGTKWVVFEPNDEPLWAKIRMNINAFMMGLFRQGAFQGTTPDKAFFVKCDGETTTANDRNLGIVNIQVGFAPLKPAEFVIITIQQIPDV